MGSDVILGIEPSSSVLLSNNKIKKFFNCPILNMLLIKPNFGCATKKIYSKCATKENAKKQVRLLNAIKNNPSIKNYAFPADVFQILFSRTGPGMFYGPHVDISLIDGKRRDLSFTLFLNDKKDYNGGELILYIPPETRTIKLNAGDIIIYPTKYIHEVKEVTEGERMVCVGWIQSEINNDDDRDLLSILKNSIGEIANNPNNNSSIKLNLNSALNRLHKRFTNLS